MADIVIGGESAGGNLAAAATLKARDIGLPLPAGVVLLSPQADLSERGDTFATLKDVDPALKSLMPVSLLYAAGVRRLLQRLSAHVHSEWDSRSVPV